jgi:hypothetical protein
MSAGAAGGAANTQAQAAQNAANLQWQQFQQMQRNLQPYMSLGTSVINPLLETLGYNVGPSAPQLSWQQIYDQMLPQFTRSGTSGGSQSSGGLAGLLVNPNATGGENGFVYPNATSSSGSTVDNQGLLDAVNAAYAAQQNSSLGNLTANPNSIFQQQFNFNPTQEQLEQTPGYQFTLQQGMKNTNNALAAKGLNLSGAQSKGLADYTTGLASNTYQQQFSNALQQFATNYGIKSDQYNRLLGLLGLGENAAAGVGNAGLQTASNAGNMLMSGANAAAAGQIGAANALSGGLSSLGGNALLYSMMNQGGNSGGFYGANFTTGLPTNYGFQVPTGLSALGYGY